MIANEDNKKNKIVLFYKKHTLEYAVDACAVKLLNVGCAVYNCSIKVADSTEKPQ